MLIEMRRKRMFETTCCFSLDLSYIFRHLCFVQFGCACGSEARICLMAFDISPVCRFLEPFVITCFFHLVCCNTRLNVHKLAFCSVSPWDAHKRGPSVSLLLEVCWCKGPVIYNDVDHRLRVYTYLYVFILYMKLSNPPAWFLDAFSVRLNCANFRFLCSSPPLRQKKISIGKKHCS